MATTYLELQNELWSDLVGTTILPLATNTSAEVMAADFIDVFQGKDDRDCRADDFPTLLLGLIYLRYSCDQSNPRSLDQQLILCLKLAKEKGFFVPWQYVFADAAVTGTTSKRTGYQHAKKTIQVKKLRVQAMFIDELGRASRDMFETLGLGITVQQAGKSLFGASDNFSMDSPSWKLQLSTYAYLHEMFSDQLGAKVDRGMDYAFKTGKVINNPGVGFRLQPQYDGDGEPVLNQKGVVLNRVVPDPETREWVLKAFSWYVEDGKSPDQIAREFNSNEVDGKQTWNGGRIRSLLSRHRFVGIEIRKRYYYKENPKTGKPQQHERPRKDWQVRRNPSLQLVPWPLFKAAQKLLVDRSAIFKQAKQDNPKRSEVYPTTLFRPTCGCCGQQLYIGRAGKYASLVCLNGRDGIHGCTYRGYKAVSIIEKSILKYICVKLLGEEAIGKLVELANQFLEKERARPQADLTKLRKAIREKDKKLKNLVGAIENAADQPGRLLKRMRELEEEKRQLTSELKLQTKSENAVKKQLDRNEILTMFKNLQGLLNSDVAVAAPILAKLTGEITIRQEQPAGSKKPIWYAVFESDLFQGLLELSKRNVDCPITDTLEFLCNRSWIKGETSCVCLKRESKVETLANQIKEMVAAGTSVETMARAMNSSWETIAQAVQLLETGSYDTKPDHRRRKRKGDAKPKQIPKYQEMAPKVTELRNAGWSFSKIAKELGICVSTVSRAFDFANPEELQRAAVSGRSRICK